MSKTSMHVQVNVTRNCLLEFLDILDQNNCHDICVTYSDYGWHVQYDSPFTRDPEVKGCVEPEKHILKVACGMSDCEHNLECVKQCRPYCGGEFYVKKLPLNSEVKNG